MTESEIPSEFSHMAPMLAEMMRIATEALTAPEVAQRLAQFSRNYHDALVAQGFNSEDAVTIVAAHGGGLLRGGK